MNELARKIVFNSLQMSKGNRNRNVQKSLVNDLYTLKTIESIQEFNASFDVLFENKLVREKLFSRNYFPMNMVDFQKAWEIPFSDNIVLELRWIFKNIEKNQEYINLFVSGKLEIEKLVISQKYNEALELLDELKSKIGESFWSLENKIFLYNKLGKNISSDIIGRCKNQIVSTVLYFYDMKASEQVEARDYNYLTRREMAKFKRIYPESIRLADFYHYMIAPFSFEMKEESIKNVLLYFLNMPLIDRYLCAIDVMEHYILNNKVDKAKEIKNIIGLLDDINDPLLDVLKFLLADSNEERNKFVAYTNNLYLKELFIGGKLEECYEQTVIYLKENNTDISAYNLLVEICGILNKNVEDAELSNYQIALLKNMQDVYSISSRYEDAIDYLNKQCFYSFHCSWGRDIFNQIIRHVKPAMSEEERLAVRYSNVHQLTIETICENLEAEVAIDYLNNHVGENRSQYYCFWKRMVAKMYENAATVCEINEIVELIHLISSDEYTKFDAYLKSDYSKINRVRASKYLWINMVTESDIEKGIDYFIHLFICREEYAIIAPVDRFINYLSNKDTNKSNIRGPILYYIFTTYFDISNRDDLFIACEDFFIENGIEKPSMMQKECENYSIEELIFFLRNVCVPQIMGPVLLSIRTSKELDEERINICQCLRKLDLENEKDYEGEIKEITQKIYINDSVSEIETNKIQVNTEGIKSRINRDLKSVFNKYIFSRNNKLDAFMNQLRSLDLSEDISIISFDSSQIFNELVTTIRNEFVLGPEYGLDAYLSLNIRHGTLKGQLRSPLAKMNMLAEKDSDTGSYEVNERWLYCIPKDIVDYRKAKDAIITFTEATDSIIEYLRKDLIQISTEEKPSAGVFKYHLDSTTISILQTYLKEDSSFEEFIDIVFEQLWKYTEINLKNMRDIIREDIKSKYNDAFYQLQKVYSNLKSPFPDAERWIKEAKNDMDAELERICNWFRRGNEGQFTDFDLDFAFQVGLKMIQNIYPEQRFETREIIKSCECKLPGWTWKYMWTIFYTLFDNISKHASECDRIKYIDCDMSVTSQKIKIRMQNDFDCTKDHANALARLNATKKLMKDKSYIVQAKKEGGSGIPKINKILSIDLKMKSKVNCFIDEQKNKFIIEIEGDSQ